MRPLGSPLSDYEIEMMQKEYEYRKALEATMMKPGPILVDVTTPSIVDNKPKKKQAKVSVAQPAGRRKIDFDDDVFEKKQKAG